MIHREWQISVSVESGSSESWPWVMDVEGFCGKHYAMSRQYQLMEHSEEKFMSICQLVAWGKKCRQKTILLSQVIYFFIFCSPSKMIQNKEIKRYNKNKSFYTETYIALVIQWIGKILYYQWVWNSWLFFSLLKIFFACASFMRI